MKAWGNAPGTMHRWIFSANGAAYHADDRLHNGLGRAFSPWWLLRAISWGVAPGLEFGFF